jgi:transcription initiation factor TFIID subunit 8
MMLRQYNIPLSSLKPHLKTPVAKELLTPEYYDPLPIPEHEDYFRTPSMDFLGPELDGNEDRKDKPWIPDAMPSFPSKHTYKFTPVETAAPDLDKKRAAAAADARRGEKALREINRAAKKSQQKELKEMAQRGNQSRQRHDNWESMMKTFIPPTSNDSQEIADQITTVDHSTTFTRREVPKVSKRGLLDAVASKG